MVRTCVFARKITRGPRRSAPGVLTPQNLCAGNVIVAHAHPLNALTKELAPGYGATITFPAQVFRRFLTRSFRTKRGHPLFARKDLLKNRPKDLRW